MGYVQLTDRPWAGTGKEQASAGMLPKDGSGLSLGCAPVSQSEGLPPPCRLIFLNWECLPGYDFICPASFWVVIPI